MGNSSSSILENDKSEPLVKHSVHQTNEYLHRVIRCYQCPMPANQSQPVLNTSDSPMGTKLKQKIRMFRRQGMNEYQILHWLQKAYGKHLICTRKVTNV